VLQVSGRAAALTDSAESGALFVAASYSRTTEDAENELKSLFADVRYAATTSDLKDTAIAGHRAIVASFSGAGGTGAVLARAIVVFSDFGTAVAAIGLARPERFAAIAAAVVSVASSVEAGLPTTNVATIAALKGHWEYAPPASAARDSSAAGTAAVQESLDFDGREHFTRAARTVVTLRGGTPVTAESDDDSGTYTVVGNTLILRGKGKARAVDIRLTGDDLNFGGRPFHRLRP
jgi:hypothetical protein